MENSDLVAGETKVKTAFTTCMVVISLWIGLGVLEFEHFLFLGVALASRLTILEGHRRMVRRINYRKL